MKQKHPLAAVKVALQQEKPSLKTQLDPLPASLIRQSQKPSHAYEKMGVLILAGGQGTRLGFDGPKGCFKLPLNPKKSLFQIQLEKVKEKGDNISVAIMTSPLNNQATQEYLESHNWFGLDPKKVDLFQQELVPMCDDQGDLIVDPDGQIVAAPDGNGKSLSYFYESGIWKRWSEKEIEFVQVLPIDNPLATPLDEQLIACHIETGAELILKSICRDDPEEKLGVIGLSGGRLTVREYSEIDLEVKAGRGNDDQLIFSQGHTGLFSCSMNFIQRVAKSFVSLPWHLAHKEKPWGWGWQFETFIFDLFPLAESFQILAGDRKKCFAPLKSMTGSTGPEEVAAALADFSRF